MFSNYMKYSMASFIVFILIAGSSNISAQEWSGPVRISEPAWGYYPQIYAAGDTVHVAYSNENDWPRTCYVRSINGGETWNSPIVLSDTTEDAGGLHPSILKFGQNLLILWEAHFSGYYGTNIGYSISFNNGTYWTSPQYVLDPNWRTIYYFTASNAGSLVNLTITLGISGDDIYIYNVRSTNFGQSWSDPIEIYHPYEISGNGDQVSYNNFVHFVWSGSFHPDSFVNLYYSRSTDSGLTWCENIDLNNSDVLWHQFPSIAVDDIGNIVVLWKERSDVVIRQSIDNGNNWSPITVVSASHYPWGCADIVLNRNLILAVWQDIYWGHGDIIFSKSYDNGYSWESEYYIDRDTSSSWNPSLAGSLKEHYVIWYDNRGDGFWFSGLYFSRWPDEFTSVADEGELLPEKITLSAYPNPFNSSTTITYSGISSGNIGIYDIRGRLVKRLPISDHAGNVTWNASSGSRNDIASGIYFARAVDFDRNYSACIKLLFIK